MIAMAKSIEMNEQTFSVIAQRFRALADPMRLRILDQLRDGGRTVGEITAACATSQPNVSRHLALLHREGILDRTQNGNRVIYTIRDPAIYDLCETVCAGIERDLEAQRSALLGDTSAPEGKAS